MKEIVINMDDAGERKVIFGMLRELKGLIRFSWVKHRRRRSDEQNRYYWPCFVHVFGEFVRDQGTLMTDWDVHEMFRLRFLKTTTVIPSTGEIVECVRSTADLSVDEFGAYLDSIAAWLADFGIVVPSPDVYRNALDIAGGGDTFPSSTPATG